MRRKKLTDLHYRSHKLRKISNLKEKIVIRKTAFTRMFNFLSTNCCGKLPNFQSPFLQNKKAGLLDSKSLKTKIKKQLSSICWFCSRECFTFVTICEDCEKQLRKTKK